MDNRPTRWQAPARIPAEIEQELLGYDPVLRQILFQRGFRTHAEAQRYLQAIPPEGCDPFGMLGMPAAAARLHEAIHKDEAIAIYGDYDADGVTATALLTQVLSELGAEVQGYIPNRFDEGYGLNIEALESLKSQGTSVVVTVDCGIRSPDEAAHAKKIGLDLIITDHHHPGSELPPAIAVINPKQTGDSYPEKNLAGVGLAYKLAAALHGANEAEVEHYLDLVALGTVADLVPLTGENRALVRRGLDYIRQPTRQGIMSLIGAAGLNPKQVNTSQIGYMLGPRLNAAGRLDTALDALALLTATEPNRAGEIAQKLDNQNRERQRLTQLVQQQAELLALGEDPEALVLFAVHSDFNPGVVGLAASRLTERYYRPAIVAHQGESETRASCRSIPGFHMTAALDQCSDLLVRHGGHAAAAGFTVRNENLPELKYRLLEIASRELAAVDLRRTLKADVEIPMYELKPEILESLKRLEPTGQENPRAVFVSRDLSIRRAYRLGRDEAHLKLDVTDGRIIYPAIAFQWGNQLDELPERIDLMYYFELNEYNGRSSLQLNVIDIKPAGISDN
jgi:single-stranded-DNA-specific exonuclease